MKFQILRWLIHYGAPISHYTTKVQQGTIYRTGDDIIGLQGGQEICLKIIHFYPVEHNKVFTPFAICDAYQYILNGFQLRHLLSDTIYVYVKPLCIVRPIMLWVEPDGKCAIVDHCRKKHPCSLNYSSSLSPSRWHGQCQRRSRWNMACWSSTGWSWTKKVKGYFFNLWSIHAGNTTTCGFNNQIQELWRVLASRASWMFCLRHGLFQTGKNKPSI